MKSGNLVNFTHNAQNFYEHSLTPDNKQLGSIAASSGALCIANRNGKKKDYCKTATKMVDESIAQFSEMKKTFKNVKKMARAYRVNGHIKYYCLNNPSLAASSFRSSLQYYGSTNLLNFDEARQVRDELQYVQSESNSHNKEAEKEAFVEEFCTKFGMKEMFPPEYRED